MKKTKPIKWYNRVSIFFIIMLFIVSNKLFSQIKVGDHPTSINPDAMIEIESTNKGLLLPRIALKSTISPSPLKSLTKGMIVFNTSMTNELTPGLYYCDGTQWIKANTNLKGSEPEINQIDYWSLKGNNNVTTNNFLGPINNVPLIIKTNNLERLRVTEKGWVGIGTSTPKATLEVNGQMIIDSISLGNTATDKILVANPSDGRVKYIAASSYTNGVQNYSEVVAYNGKAIFTTPAIISDVNKILLYRNGVLISFVINNSTSILSELPCKQGDQIRIVQLL